jgi:hypothetical protein
MKTVTTLTENVEKEDPKWPDFTGQLTLERDLFDVGAWINRVRSTNDPCIGLNLSLRRDRNAERIGVTLWQKKNRNASVMNGYSAAKGGATDA